MCVCLLDFETRHKMREPCYGLTLFLSGVSAWKSGQHVFSMNWVYKIIIFFLIHDLI